MAVFELIEGCYKLHRRHSALDYHSPINYERIHQTHTFTASRTPSTQFGVTSEEAIRPWKRYRWPQTKKPLL